MVGDWNGDGRDELGTYDASTGIWRLSDLITAGSSSPDEFESLTLPRPGLPIVGDRDDDFDARPGFYDPASMTWVLRTD